MKQLTAWIYYVVFYVHNRRLGWSRDDLVTCRRIAAKW